MAEKADPRDAGTNDGSKEALEGGGIIGTYKWKVGLQDHGHWFRVRACTRIGVVGLKLFSTQEDHGGEATKTNNPPRRSEGGEAVPLNVPSFQS